MSKAKKLSFKEESNVNIEDRLRQEHDQWYIDITDIAIEMFGDIVDKVEITDFYDYTKEEAIEKIKQNSRHYAKRQYTFFNHQLDVKWFDCDVNNFDNTIKEVVNYIENN